MSDYVTEAGHWYDKNGAPAYTQTVASGKRQGLDRPTTIRDARKHSLVPSVTTIMGILDKPALNHWKIGQAVEKALAKERGEEWKENDSAKIGTEIHGALESFIQTGKVKKGYQPYITILKSVMETTGVSSPIPERSFSSPLGYGGAIDLSDSTGDGIIIDFKTKDIFMEDGVLMKPSGDSAVRVGKLAYDDHITQLSAYRVGIERPKAKLYNLFLSRIEPETYVLHEWTEDEAQWGWEMFMATHQTWKVQKRFCHE